jgi:glutaredoxin
MDKKIIWTTVIVSLVILILGYILVDSSNKKAKIKVNLPSKDKIVYYYGLTCPHCKEVEEWMKKNKIEEKIKVEKKEVWYNKENAAELQEVAKFCSLDPTSIGVPFLWADGKCYIGTSGVERILAEKLKMRK